MRRRNVNYLVRKKIERRLRICLLCCVILLLLLLLWKESARKTARWVPSYDKVSLEVVDTVADLSQEELDFIFAQTGLTAVGLSRLEEAGRLRELSQFQTSFFLPAVEMKPEEAIAMETPWEVLPIETFQNSIISWEESVLSSEGLRGAYLPIVPVEEGDILLTSNSRCFGWRQGHSALVVTEDTVLESLVLGMNSKLQDISKWQGFPAVMVLRPKDSSLGEVAVEYAMDYLLDVPYTLTVGLFSPRYTSLGYMVEGTHCAHLIWQTYAWLGLNLDSNGGVFTAPSNLSKSTDLELVQIWGINPEKMWN